MTKQQKYKENFKKNKEEIFLLLSQGKSYTYIGKKFQIDRKYLSFLLHQEYSQAVQLPMSAQAKKEMLAQKTDLIIQLYESGETTASLGKKFGVSSTTIGNLLHNCGINMKPKHRKKKNTFLEDFFTFLETGTEKAQYQFYLLGLLLADGTNSVKNKTVSISLQERDKDILEKVSNILEFNGQLQYINIKQYHQNSEKLSNQYRLTLFSEKFSKDLERLGMVENKTLKLDFPKFIPDTELPHFIRGFFDGDGCISYSHTISPKTNSKPCTRTYINFVGIENFIIPLAQHIEKQTGIQCHIRHPKGKSDFIRTLVFSAKGDVMNFINFLYRNSLIHLNRKHDKAMLILENEKKVLKEN